MDTFIQTVKRHADRLRDVQTMSDAQRADAIDHLLGSVGRAMMESGIPVDTVASAFLRHAILSYGHAHAGAAEDPSLVGVAGISEILSRTAPAEPDANLGEALCLLSAVQTRADIHAESTGRDNGEPGDFDNLFKHGITADTEDVEDAVGALQREIGKIDTAQILIHQGQALITEELGHHRAVQHLLRCTNYHLMHLVDPAGSPERDRQIHQLAELDIEAEGERDGELGAIMRAMLDPQPEYTEPFDPDACPPETIANTREYDLDSLEANTADFVFPDFLDARWYELFTLLEWSVDALETGGDLRRPSFRMRGPDAAPVDVFTVEDAQLLSDNPDSPDALAQSGVMYRLMTERAILLVGMEICFLTTDPETEEGSPEPDHALLGWYLPPLDPGDAPRLARETGRAWRIAELAPTAESAEIVLEPPGGEFDDAFVAQANAAFCRWLRRCESSADEEVRDTGYEAEFTRRFRRAVRRVRAQR